MCKLFCLCCKMTIYTRCFVGHCFRLKIFHHITAHTERFTHLVLCVNYYHFLCNFSSTVKNCLHFALSMFFPFRKFRIKFVGKNAIFELLLSVNFLFRLWWNQCQKSFSMYLVRDQKTIRRKTIENCLSYFPWFRLLWCAFIDFPT